MDDTAQSLTFVFNQHDCWYHTLHDGTQIRRYRQNERIERRHYLLGHERPTTTEDTQCDVFMKWKDDHFVEWYDMQEGAKLFAATPTFRAAALPYVDEYYQCGREKEYSASPSSNGLQERWKAVPIMDKKFAGKIRHFLALWPRYDTAKEYYMLYQASDESEDPSPHEIERETVKSMVRQCQYLEASTRRKDIEAEYRQNRERCWLPEFQYLKDQLPKIDKKSPMVRGVEDRIEVLQMRLEMHQLIPKTAAKKVTWKKRIFDVDALLTQLHDLSVED